ncbi:MAG: RecQ family ATP-dependent DNA helicase [Prochlorotrichaceae cyanobacterium]
MLPTTPETVLQAFQQIWGYSSFRSPQGEIVQAILSGQDSLIVMPTGGGKSICFQLPALLQEGITLVISPLVALMENQVEELRIKKLAAGLLHSQLPKSDRLRTLQQLEQQRLRLLYLSPETLFSPKVWQLLLRPEMVINALILDEAHCLVQWGDTFRPAYRRLGMVRPTLLRHKPPGSKIAIAAFTATANPQAQGILRSVLQLHNPQEFLLNPYRKNLILQVQTVWTPRGRRQRLRHFLQQQQGTAGLIYVRTRQDSETLAQDLQKLHYKTQPYHAGLSSAQRRQIEADWQSDRLQFVVCTNAFGMGINKPNVRWVCHFQAPLLLSEYVQEVGRAGRDGLPATALSLVSEPTGYLDDSDRRRWQYFLKQLQDQYQAAQREISKLPNEGDIQVLSRNMPQAPFMLSLLHSAGQVEWLDPFHYRRRPGKAQRNPVQEQRNAAQEMQRYLQTRKCRWAFILHAFGFSDGADSFTCGHCDRCRGNVPKGSL